MEKLFLNLFFTSGEEYSIICTKTDLEDLIFNLSVNTSLLQINKDFICLRHIERFLYKEIE
jgi:hypothetical protein